jgi:hypothetical protein
VGDSLEDILVGSAGGLVGRTLASVAAWSRPSRASRTRQSSEG